MEIVLGFILIVILLAVIMGASAILDGWVLKVLWGWFMVPTFGLPALTLPVAIGVGLVVSYMTHQMETRPKEKEQGKEASTYLFLALFVRPFIALGIGWVIHQFM